MYIGERAVRFYRHKNQNTTVLGVKLLEGGVLGLKLSKPKAFDYKPGMYVFLNIPCLSVFEWHPFSLTSSPHDEFISVHVRSAGDWTTNLFELFSESPYHYINRIPTPFHGVPLHKHSSPENHTTGLTWHVLDNR